ncbi:MAG TPA: hypothetical protein VLM85_15710 [Polyangiaceae bacterium]|nr:hypothetical protein [Polyangiaceae bacterium]
MLEAAARSPEIHLEPALVTHLLRREYPTDAAAALGVTRYALARAIKKHGLRDAH